MEHTEVFKLLAEECKDDYLLYGDFILVQILPDEELKKGSIVLATRPDQRLNSFNSNKPIFCRVLQPGVGFEDEDGTLKPLAAERGEVVVVGQNSPLAFSRFGKIPMDERLQLALIRESDIIMQFTGEEAYRRYFDTLESLLEGKKA